MADAAEPIEMAAEITAAWLANPHTRANAEEVSALLATMHRAISELGQTTPDPSEPVELSGHAPAVSARKSLASPDHIISMMMARSIGR